MTGKIHRIVKDKGYGFIRVGKDDYFFHRSALKNIQFEVLEIGQEVEFEESISDKGRRADDIFA